MAGKKRTRKEVVLSPQAENDILELMDYLHVTWGQKIASFFLSRLLQFYAVIALNPRLFPFYNKKKNIRKYNISKHTLLFYRNRRKTVAIIAVFDARQSPATIKKSIVKRGQ